MNKTSIFGCVVGALTAATSLAQTVTTIVNNGDSADLYDIVIIGDGYRASEESAFNNDVSRVVNALRNDSINYPVDSYFDCYNVHSVFRASNESGADDPAAGVVRDTAYDASYGVGGTQRCLYLATSAGRARATADASLAPDNDGRVMVIVNDSQYGGCASTFAVSYNGRQLENVQSHEWGHAFGALADEYDYGESGTYSGPEFSEPNVTNSSTGNKWSQWSGVAGQYGTVGAYEGARYYRTGIWRPEPDCKMRSNGRRYCTICREHLIKRFNQLCHMIRSPSPDTRTNAQSGAQLTFSFVNGLATRAHSIEWSIDGGAWATGSTTFQWDTTGAPDGTHTVRARLTDLNPDVRSDPSGLMSHTETWLVEIREPTVLGTFAKSGNGCPTANPLTLRAATVPTIGQTLTIELVDVPLSTTAASLLGGGNSTNLPLDTLGMAGCSLLTSADYFALPMSVLAPPFGSIDLCRGRPRHARHQRGSPGDRDRARNHELWHHHFGCRHDLGRQPADVRRS